MRIALSLLLALFASPISAAPYDPIFHDAFQSTTDCPSGRRISGTVNYQWGTGSSQNNLMRDLRSMDAVFGSLDRTPPRTLPWVQGIHPTIMALGRHEYLALAFTAPAVVIPTQRGTIYHAETTPGPIVAAALSRYCGDFAPPQAACAFPRALTGGAVAAWAYPASPVITACRFEPGGVYYFNLKFANPAEVRIPECGPNGTGPTCKVTFTSNSNP